MPRRERTRIVTVAVAAKEVILARRRTVPGADGKYREE
jgi:hypothetical protein